MKIEVYSPTIKRKEMDAVLTAMVEDRIGPGEHTRFLIHTAKEQQGFDYCLALRSPVFALQLILEALLGNSGGSSACGTVSGESAPRAENETGAAGGRGVLISALSPLYYERVIRSMGLTPLYCDTQTDSPLMAPAKIESLLSSRPLCMIFHETLGYLPETDYADLGIPVIFDSSQSFGGFWGEKKDSLENGTGHGTKLRAGSRGTFTILGLEERDMITAGGGALLYANSRKDAALLRALGELPPEYTLPDVNAAMAAVQFRESEKNLAKRREIAEAYIKASMQTRHRRFVQGGGFEYNNYAFPLLIETGVKDVKAYAKRKEITVEEAFELSLAGSGVIPTAQCPNASSIAMRTLLFPLYPRLGASQAGKVAKLITTLP